MKKVKQEAAHAERVWLTEYDLFHFPLKNTITDHIHWFKYDDLKYTKGNFESGQRNVLISLILSNFTSLR